MLKKILKVVIIVFAVVIVVIASIYTYATWGMKKTLQLELSSIDFTQVADGKYTGSYQNARWSNTAEVEVLDGKIVHIVIVKDVAMPLEGVQEKIIDAVIDKQNIDIDAISSATVTSHAYLKAIEDALNNELVAAQTN